MTRRGAVEGMLARYGSPAAAGGREVRAVIRPLRFDSGADPDSAGLYYRYAGPAGSPLSPGDTVETPRRSYAVRRSETALLGGEELYVRAVLRALPGDADEEIVLLSPGGEVLARAERYEEKTVRGSFPVRSWGEGAPSEIAEGGTSYELALSGVHPENGSLGLGEFSVEIRGKGRKVVFSGCRVESGSVSGGGTLSPQSSLKILAASRAEEAIEA